MNKTFKWHEISKKGVNFENLLVSIMAYGYIDLQQQGSKKFGPAYVTGYRQMDTHRDILQADYDHFIKQAKLVENKKPGSILESYNHYEKMLAATEKFAAISFQKNFTSQTNAQLVELFKRLTLTVRRLIWYGYNYYFYQYLADELYAIISQKERNINQQAELFEILTQSSKLSVVQQEQKDLVLLVKKIKRNKLSLASSQVRQLVARHCSKYAYMGFYYFRGRAHSEKYFLKRVEQRLHTNYERQLDKILSLEKDSNNWLTLAQRLNFNSREKILVKTLKQMAYCTNHFDEVNNFLYFKGQNFLKEIAKRLGITYQELIEMDVQEIIDFLAREKTVDQKFRVILRQRLKDSALIMVDRKVTILTGGELAVYRRTEAKQTTRSEKFKLLKGQPASAGRAKGKAVLVYSIADLGKVKRGNIMVAKSTVPSFVPAMERAIGIVTEMGGLLSHAAIVARELKIPCVVGVPEAMKVIKPGQPVEVDATKGIVRKV